MPKKKRAQCPMCQREFLLKKDGTLRHHGGVAEGPWNYRAYRCEGAGQKPVDPAEKPQPGDTVRVTYPENWNRKPFTTVVGDNGIYLSQAYVESGTATVEIVERARPTNVET